MALNIDRPKAYFRPNSRECSQCSHWPWAKIAQARHAIGDYVVYKPQPFSRDGRVAKTSTMAGGFVLSSQNETQRSG